MSSCVKVAFGIDSWCLVFYQETNHAMQKIHLLEIVSFGVVGCED
jgi:hypothetical protein